MDLLRSLPLGLYLEEPVTWMHRLDPRVKLAWLMTFLAAPLLANVAWRLGLVGLLFGLTVSARVPVRVWRQQLGWLMALSLYVGMLILFLPDGLNAEHQMRLPANELAFAQQPRELPPPLPDRPWYNPFPAPTIAVAPALKQPTDYRYILFRFGNFLVSQRSLSLALRTSTLIFTLIYSPNLYLLTTAPEEITAGIEDLMGPLRRLRVPVTELALTLTLALRFIPLVLEEFQNLVRSVRTRAINWKKLGWRRAIGVWMLVAERLLENLLLRAEQMSGAMQVRGFTSPDRHRVEWHQLRLRRGDWVALISLFGLWALRIGSGGDVV
jgi:energy-coupling factor transport system permease protein